MKWEYCTPEYWRGCHKNCLGEVLAEPKKGVWHWFLEIGPHGEYEITCNKNYKTAQGAIYACERIANQLEGVK